MQCCFERYNVASVMLRNHTGIKINGHHCWSSSYSVFINSYFYSHPQWFIKITEGARFPRFLFHPHCSSFITRLGCSILSIFHFHLSVLGLCSLTHPYPEEIKRSVSRTQSVQMHAHPMVMNKNTSC